MITIYPTDVAEIVMKKAILVIDLDTREILWVTERFEKMFGYHLRNELTGKQVEILVPLSVRPKHPEFVKGYADNPESRQMGMIVSGVKKNGTEFRVVVDLDAQVISGQRCGIATVTDISNAMPAINAVKQSWKGLS